MTGQQRDPEVEELPASDEESGNSMLDYLKFRRIARTRFTKSSQLSRGTWIKGGRSSRYRCIEKTCWSIIMNALVTTRTTSTRCNLLVRRRPRWRNGLPSWTRLIENGQSSSTDTSEKLLILNRTTSLLKIILQTPVPRESKLDYDRTRGDLPRN